MILDLVRQRRSLNFDLSRLNFFYFFRFIIYFVSNRKVRDKQSEGNCLGNKSNLLNYKLNELKKISTLKKYKDYIRKAIE